jgi:glutamate:Na+ symporter, ESS family
MTLEVDVFGTTTIAMCVFFLGYAIVMRSQLLRDYSIPEPVIGGFACAILIALVYYIANVEITFDPDVTSSWFISSRHWGCAQVCGS